MKQQRGTVAVIIGASLCVWPTTSNAGLFSGIGKAVGGFFRSVGNVLGQGLAGLAQPTIDDTSNQMQRVGLSLIDQADKAAGRRIEQLSEKISEAIEKTDGVLQKQLQVLDEMLSKKLGAVDVIGAKQINNFEVAVVNIVQYASLLFLLTALIAILGMFLFKRLSAEKYERMGAPNWLAAALLLVTLSGLGYFATIAVSPPSQGKLAALRTDLLKSFKYAMQLGDLSGATFYASQLNVLDSSHLGSRVLVELSDLQRDLLSRPALLKTVRGSLELNARIARLDRTWDLLLDQKLVLGDLSFLPHELSATAAMIVWQTARVERDELVAACSATQAISEFNKHTPDVKIGDASPFIWISYSYAKWTSIRSPNAVFTCPDGKSLSAQIADSQAVIAKFDAEPPNPVVEQAILYNRAASRYYVAASRAYSSLVVADTQLRWKANKDPYRIERDKAADEVIAAWSEFLNNVRQIPGAVGSNMVLAMNGLPLAMAQRALSLKGADPAAGRPGFDLAGCSAAIGQLVSPDTNARSAGEQGRFGQFLIFFDVSVRPFVCSEQSMLDARIVAFENALVAAVTRPGVDPVIERGKLLNDPQIASLAGSLLACVVLADATISGDRGCKIGESSQVKTLAAWLRPGAPEVEPDKLQRFAFVR